MKLKLIPRISIQLRFLKCEVAEWIINVLPTKGTECFWKTTFGANQGMNNRFSFGIYVGGRMVGFVDWFVTELVMMQLFADRRYEDTHFMFDPLKNQTQKKLRFLIYKACQGSTFARNVSAFRTFSKNFP